MSAPRFVHEQAPDAVEDEARAEMRNGVAFIPKDEAVAIASRPADRWSGVLERLDR